MTFIPLAPVLQSPLYGEMLLPQRPVAALLIVHGIGEYGGRYQSAMRHLAGREIACFVYDQRGHGRSPGPRGDVERFQLFVDDLLTIAKGVRRVHPDLPLFLWAHSMGSLVALLGVGQLSQELRGVATSGCPIAVFARTTRWLLPPMQLLARAAPRAKIASVLGARALTHDVAVQRAYIEDPLVEHSSTLRLLAGLGAACIQAREAAPRLTPPWLAVHGQEDRVAPPHGSRELIGLLASEDKQLILYPGLRHEVHNELEPGRSKFLDTLAQWILDRRKR